MKIDGLVLRHLRMPLKSPFETSFGKEVDRECILLELHSEGIVGYGECVASSFPGYSYETVGTAWHIITEFIAPRIVGANITEPAEFPALVGGIRGHNLAKAGVEMALWDLFGKSLGRSLRAMLGGREARVSVGVSIGLQSSPSVLVDVVRTYLEEGYTRVKIKIKPGRDVQEAAAVRTAFADLRLQVDANSAFTLATAESLRPLDDLDLLLIEQPLSEDDIWDHRRLQASFRTPICLDESIVSARHARYAFEMGACRIINIKAGRVGGLTEAIAVHDYCREKDVPVWCGGMLETGVGRASNLALASLPGFTLPGDISASDRYYAEDITEERFVLNADSTIDVPSGPGLGVKVDTRAVNRFTLTKSDLKNGRFVHPVPVQ